MSLLAPYTVEDLLKPVSDALPAGPNARSEAALAKRYADLRSLRDKLSLEESGLRQSDQPGFADWRPVVKEASELLAKHTKDFWVGAWLIEGLLRTGGFAGLSEGFAVVAGLARQYWAGAWPAADEGAEPATYDDRLARLTGLNGGDREGALIVPLNMLQIIPATSAGGPFTTADFIRATPTAGVKDPEQLAALEAKGALTYVKMSAVAATVDEKELRRIHAEIVAAKAAFADFSAAMDEAAGGALPSTWIKETLEHAVTAITSLGGARLGEAAAAAGTPAVDAAAGTGGGGGGTIAVGNIRSRDEAFTRLLEIADFFRRNDPQSLVSYALEQVVRWGRMPLPELLGEFVPEDGRTRFTWLGIAPQPPAEKQE